MKKVMFYVVLVVLCFVCNPWPVEAKEVVTAEDVKETKEVTFNEVYSAMKAEIEDGRDEYGYIYHEFSMDDEYAYWKIEVKNEENTEVHIKIYDGAVVGIIVVDGIEEDVRVLSYAEYMALVEEG